VICSSRKKSGEWTLSIAWSASFRRLGALLRPRAAGWERGFQIEPLTLWRFGKKIRRAERILKIGLDSEHPASGAEKEIVKRELKERAEMGVVIGGTKTPPQCFLRLRRIPVEH
jgi:hypothetical protein